MDELLNVNGRLHTSLFLGLSFRSPAERYLDSVKIETNGLLLYFGRRDCKGAYLGHDFWIEIFLEETAAKVGRLLTDENVDAFCSLWSTSKEPVARSIEEGQTVDEAGVRWTQSMMLIYPPLVFRRNGYQVYIRESHTLSASEKIEFARSFFFFKPTASSIPYSLRAFRSLHPSLPIDDKFQAPRQLIEQELEAWVNLREREGSVIDRFHLELYRERYEQAFSIVPAVLQRLRAYDQTQPNVLTKELIVDYTILSGDLDQATDLARVLVDDLGQVWSKRRRFMLRAFLRLVLSMHEEVVELAQSYAGEAFAKGDRTHLPSEIAVIESIARPDQTRFTETMTALIDEHHRAVCNPRSQLSSSLDALLFLRGMSLCVLAKRRDLALDFPALVEKRRINSFAYFREVEEWEGKRLPLKARFGVDTCYTPLEMVKLARPQEAE